MPTKVAIIIPHCNGRELLGNCLASLFRTDYPDFRVYLVDNASTDGSPEWARQSYPQLMVIRSETNLGYAGGCNLGIRSTAEELVVLLNNDTEVEPNWLGKLVEVIESDPAIAAVQPKIRWLRDRTRFDYSGGVGGMMDVFGYPFCLGRLFDHQERDTGQYDGIHRDIFWASGSASIYRRRALDQAGLMDEDFFMHMEEIDLAWRLHLVGFRVCSAPSSVVYHLSGGSLPAGNFRKMYLNHRNSLLMLWKNYSLARLAWIWPARLALEALALAKALASGNWEWARAIVQAGLWLAENPCRVMGKRRNVQRMRKVSDRLISGRMYRGSIAVEYFLRGKRTVREL